MNNKISKNGKKKEKIKEVEKDRIAVFYLNACAYRMTAYTLVNNLNAFGSGCNIFSPIVVNGMLAIELYLKFLKCYYDGKSGKAYFLGSHSPKRLFESLAKDKRDIVLSRYLSIKGEQIRWDTFLNQSEEKNGDPVEWRYLSREEEYRIDLETMIKVIETLHIVAEECINLGGENYSLPQMSSPFPDERARSIIDQFDIEIQEPTDF